MYLIYDIINGSLNLFSANTVYMTDLPPPYPGITGYSGYATAPNGSVGFAPPPTMNGAMGFAPPPMMNTGKPFLFVDNWKLQSWLQSWHTKLYYKICIGLTHWDITILRYFQKCLGPENLTTYRCRTDWKIRKTHSAFPKRKKSCIKRK